MTLLLVWQNFRPLLSIFDETLRHLDLCIGLSLSVKYSEIRPNFSNIGWVCRTSGCRGAAVGPSGWPQPGFLSAVAAAWPKNTGNCRKERECYSCNRSFVVRGPAIWVARLQRRLFGASEHDSPYQSKVQSFSITKPVFSSVWFTSKVASDDSELFRKLPGWRVYAGGRSRGVGYERRQSLALWRVGGVGPPSAITCQMYSTARTLLKSIDRKALLEISVFLSFEKAKIPQNFLKKK